MIFLLLALSCPVTKMQNTSGYSWNNYDRSELKYARKRCGEIWPDSPCLKLFKKYDKKQYSCICGSKK
jgi:hypothetical protein